MSDPEARLQRLELQVEQLTTQLLEIRQLLHLVGDVQRFSRLRNLLEVGDLDRADLETARLMEVELSSGDEGPSPESMSRCAAAPLHIINALWSSHSQGRQGFVVQLNGYLQLGGNRNSLIAQDEQLFHRFTDSVGWPLVPGVGFALPEQLSVPVASAVNAQGVVLAGHLPLRCWSCDYGLKAANLLMARLMEVFADP